MFELAPNLIFFFFTLAGRALNREGRLFERLLFCPYTNISTKHLTKSQDNFDSLLPYYNLLIQHVQY